MTAQEFLDNKDWVKDTIHFSIDDVIELIEEYARIKCLEAIRNTRYAAIDIVTHHIDSQFNLPVDENDVHDLIRDIQNIPDQDVMPKL